MTLSAGEKEKKKKIVNREIRQIRETTEGSLRRADEFCFSCIWRISRFMILAVKPRFPFAYFAPLRG